MQGLFSLAGHKGPKAVRRYMSEGQMNTTALCLSMFVEVNKGPNKNGLGPDLAHGPPFEKACTSAMTKLYSLYTKTQTLNL